MTENQAKYYEGMSTKFDAELMKNPAFDKAVQMYAKMCAEEDDLQKFVDEHGTSYQAVNREGTTMWKHYPQHQSLSKLRTQMTAVLRTLLKYATGEVTNDDEMDLLA